MNRQEHLLTILAEECNEVAQRVSKALRFGLNEVQEGQNLNNSERIKQEMQDLIGTFELLLEENILEDVDQVECERKKEKIKKYLEYSKKQGTLT